MCTNDNIINVCNTEYDNFLNKRNVVGLALSYKVTDGVITDENCIKVFVTKKLPINKLSSVDLVPKNYNGIKTDVVEVGEIHSLALTSKIIPMLFGYSIGPYIRNILLAGTAGCLVTDGRNYYILSNNHVLANENTLSLNTPILQPGTYDGGRLATDQIATLSKYISIKFKTARTTPANTVDAAIARVNNINLVSPSIALIGNVAGSIAPSINMPVKKSGRTTGLTTGLITSTNATVLVGYSNNKTALFTNQILTTPMSISGDSGSLLLNNDNYAVGLLFAGSNSITVYNPIASVLSALNVRLVTV